MTPLPRNHAALITKHQTILLGAPDTSLATGHPTADFDAAQTHFTHTRITKKCEHGDRWNKGALRAGAAGAGGCA